MKEAAIHSARRRESSRSLEVDASSCSSSTSPSSSSSSSLIDSSIPRRASTTSLKTVRSLDQSPIKEEEVEKSLSLKRTLTRKLSYFFEAESSPSSGWNGLGPISSLKTLGALGLSPGKKPTGDNHEPEEEETDTLRKRLSRRLSSLFDGNSEAALQSPSSSPTPELRPPVKRRDLPICWIESLTAFTSTKGKGNQPSLDLLTRLASRVYTRHLARQILQHLSKQDLTTMTTVCNSWRKLCKREMATDG